MLTTRRLFVTLLLSSGLCVGSGCYGPLRLVRTSHLRALQASPSQADLDSCERDRTLADADLAACQYLGRREIGRAHV